MTIPANARTPRATPIVLIDKDTVIISFVSSSNSTVLLVVNPRTLVSTLYSPVSLKEYF